uniref:Uncharacterized protein n=1 Tax=Panagrolaimus davidi TaxID=227884 RepID=A0A914PBL6_9BILA
MSDTLPILIAGYSIAIFGFVSSVISLWLIYKITVLHNGFGLISAAQSIVEGSILFFNVFVAYTTILM